MERVRANSGNAAPARPASGPSTSSKVLVGILVVVGLVLVAGMYFGLANGFSGNGVKSNQYQAVFLTNGQVYFGKLSDLNSGYAKLSDIYYLQVTQQPGSEEALQTGDNAQVDPQISLAQLGNELHGPEREMYISQDQILFWENLRDDGDVVTAIREFAENNTEE